MKVSDLKKLKEIGVRRAVIKDGQVVEVEFQDISPDAAVIGEIQKTLAKWDADYEALTPEERMERLHYGHSV
jgi:hypothetical protein